MSAPRDLAAIAIGASAGGVEALSQVLPAVPANARLPIFVVLHLPRERPSLLPSVLQSQCACPVKEALDKEPIEPGTIYCAPPDYHLLIDRGPQLALSTDEQVNYSRPSIDVLFESAAEEYGRRLMAVVLTGASMDGAAGLRAVRLAGGTTVVQDPATALARAMPEAALQAGPVDFVLPLDGIAQLIGQAAAGGAP